MVHAGLFLLLAGTAALRFGALLPVLWLALGYAVASELVQAALLLAWTAGSGLSALVRSYSAQTEQREAERTEAAQRRRAQDRAPTDPVTAED